MIKITLIVTISLLLFSGCGMDEKDDEGFELIKDLTILAIKAEPPETIPGTEIALKGLIVDPEKREISSAWFISNDTDLTNNFDIEEATPIDKGEEISFTTPIQRGRYTIFLIANTSPPPLDYDEFLDGEHFITAKEIIISENDRPNRNPVIKDISADPIDILTGNNVTITADADDPDGDELTYAWRSTKPGLEKDHGNMVNWHAPEEPGDYLVYLVVRDKRGGTAWDMITLNVHINKNQSEKEKE